MYERESIEDYIRRERGSVSCPAAGEQIVMLLKCAAPVLALLASSRKQQRTSNSIPSQRLMTLTQSVVLQQLLILSPWQP